MTTNTTSGSYVTNAQEGRYEGITRPYSVADVQRLRG